ncbi:hypothetical protein KOW79_017598 [Hemibagrus wyckioides]|uniref:Uncharacterized protein n=1 Tax=Hemibagrus wyckioides TaxID=337641 RepID=A0A9D3NCU4_9TELE|nr:hypothetical protein KOW79_017598 [Hemibagrus wyckioides]
MTNMQSLSIFLTERLMLAAQEIFKAVEVTVTEYHDEISRSRQENELLKSRLLEAGIPFYPELQPGLSVFHGEPCVGSERGDPGEKIHVKQEPSVSREEHRVPPPQTSAPEEPVSPSVCLDDEQRIEDMLHPQMTDSSPSPLLQAHQCMQIKEESDECKSGLGAEIFCTSQSSTSDELSSAVASNHTSGLETELDRLSSMHNASELPLTSRVKAGQPKRCVNYNPAEHHKVLQRRERYSMIRARGIGKLPKVGRERKTEPRIENQRACRKKERLPEVMMLDEEQCMPRQLCLSTGSLNERNVQPGHKSSAVYQSEPEANLGLQKTGNAVFSHPGSLF